MFKILKKDSFSTGLLIGLISPVIFFGVIYLINMLIMMIFELDIFIRLSIMKLLSIFINLLPIWYYFVRLKNEQTGRGVLLVTFVYMVVYFWLIYP